MRIKRIPQEMPISETFPFPDVSLRSDKHFHLPVTSRVRYPDCMSWKKGNALLFFPAPTIYCTHR